MRAPARLQQRAFALLWFVAVSAARGSNRDSDSDTRPEGSPSRGGQRAGGVVFMVTYHKSGTYLSYTLRHVAANYSLVSSQAVKR
jgi:hypothetical protein